MDLKQNIQLFCDLVKVFTRCFHMLERNVQRSILQLLVWLHTRIVAVEEGMQTLGQTLGREYIARLESYLRVIAYPLSSGNWKDRVPMAEQLILGIDPYIEEILADPRSREDKKLMAKIPLHTKGSKLPRLHDEKKTSCGLTEFKKR